MRATASVAVVGPTATGKTELAMALAARLGEVELVSVDAIACYRGLDVGSAKPSASMRAERPWHLLDVADPSEEFSVTRFAPLARAALAEIGGRRRRALLVGGTGLYHRAVVDDLAFAGRYPEIALRLEAEADRPGGLAELFARLGRLDPLAQSRVEAGNRRRIVRALEVIEGSGTRFSDNGPGLQAYPPSAVLQIGLRLERDELDRRIAARLGAQMAAGFLEEVAALAERPGGLSRTVVQAIGYRELLAHLAGELSLAEAEAQILRRTRRFARRQLAWFGRDPRVRWLDATQPDLAGAALELLTEAAGGPTGTPRV